MVFSPIFSSTHISDSIWFFVLLSGSSQPGFTFKTARDKKLKSYYLCILGSSCREGMKFQVPLNCKFDLRFTQKNRTLHIYILLFRKYRKRVKQNNKKPCHNRWNLTNPLRSDNHPNCTTPRFSCVVGMKHLYKHLNYTLLLTDIAQPCLAQNCCKTVCF